MQRPDEARGDEDGQLLHPAEGHHLLVPARALQHGRGRRRMDGGTWLAPPFVLTVLLKLKVSLSLIRIQRKINLYTVPL